MTFFLLRYALLVWNSAENYHTWIAKNNWLGINIERESSLINTRKFTQYKGKDYQGYISRTSQSFIVITTLCQDSGYGLNNVEDFLNDKYECNLDSVPVCKL